LPLPQAQAVELACRCDDVSDDAVELRLLKALLTAVTSTTLAVHGQALLLVVRACYNIFLTSRSDVNQATAKATLTQVCALAWPASQRAAILLLLAKHVRKA
jgi:brefeldin A-inhibited guanine nucleotide-exchange protein